MQRDTSKHISTVHSILHASMPVAVAGHCSTPLFLQPSYSSLHFVLRATERQTDKQKDAREPPVHRNDWSYMHRQVSLRSVGCYALFPHARRQHGCYCNLGSAQRYTVNYILTRTKPFLPLFGEEAFLLDGWDSRNHAVNPVHLENKSALPSPPFMVISEVRTDLQTDIF